MSPAGTRLVFYAEDQTGKGSLWLRDLDSFEARELRETGGAFQPFWSPDGKSIGFFAERNCTSLIWREADRSEVCSFVGNARGGSWSATGSIVFATTNPSGLMRVASQGGNPSPDRLSGAENNGAPLSWPSFLPDGHRFSYSARTKQPIGADLSSIDRARTATLERSYTSDTQAVFVAPGYLLLWPRRAAPSSGVRRGDLVVCQESAVAVVDSLRVTPIKSRPASSRRPTLACWRIGRG